MDTETASALGLGDFTALDLDAIGRRCDLGLVVGGDGTMLGVGRRIARWGIPLIGINQGRLGFITELLSKQRPWHGLIAAREAAAVRTDPERAALMLPVLAELLGGDA